MLSYAPRPKPTVSPAAAAMVVGLHAAAFAAVLLIKPDLVPFVKYEPIEVIPVPLPEPPPPEPVPPETEAAPPPPRQPKLEWTVPEPEIAIARPQNPVGSTFEFPDVISVNPADVPLGPATPYVEVPEPPAPLPAPVAARLLTSGSDLKPPYPAALQRQGKEEALRLRLEIDRTGRVTRVTLLNDADPRFFRAAQDHIKKVWRYAPATRGGTPTATDLVVTLRFELTG